MITIGNDALADLTIYDFQYSFFLSHEVHCIWQLQGIKKNNHALYHRVSRKQCGEMHLGCMKLS